MNFQEFQYTRKHFLKEGNLTPADVESLKDSESWAVFEFLQERYQNEPLNEGLISSIVSWYRRNFSPRATKIKKLAKQYYEWLMSEYNATYKKADDDTPLEAFLKKEKISSDIEQQILDTASDHEDYAALAKKVILESKIRAKKDFSKKILGSEAELTRQYASQLAGASEEVNDAMKNLSREDARRFEFDLKTLRERIKKDGKRPETAARIASGIMVFAQNRKLEMFRDYSPEELWKEYERGEKIYLSVTPSLNNEKGAEYMFSIRASKDPNLMKLSRMLAKQIKEEVDKINQSLLDVGVDVEGEGLRKYWGLIELYLKQSDPESQQKTLDVIREKVKEMSDGEKEEFASDVEEDLNDISQTTQDPEREAEKVADLRQSMSQSASTGSQERKPWRSYKGKRRKQEKWKEKQRQKNGEGRSSAPDSSKPAQEESSFGPVAAKLIDALIEKPDPVYEGMKDYIIALATVEDRNGKLVWNSVAKATETAIKSGLNDPNKGIPAELVEQAKKYVTDMNAENPLASKFDERLLKSSADALFADYKTGLKIWEDSLEKADEETQKELASKAFFAALFKDKKGTSEPLTEEKVKEHMGNSFEFYL